MIIIETCPKCGHDLLDVLLTTYPPIPKKECPSCGWSWTGEREEIVRVPFGGNSYYEEQNNILGGVIADEDIQKYLKEYANLTDVTGGLYEV